MAETKRGPVGATSEVIEYVTEKMVVDRQSRFRCRHVSSGFDWYFLQVISEISRVFLDRKKSASSFFLQDILCNGFFSL